MSLPNDPVILFSYVNTLLRDTFPNLDELCKSLSADRKNIEDKLGAIGYFYDEKLNRFR